MRGFAYGVLGISALYWGVTSPVVGPYLGVAGQAVATFLRRLSDPTVPGIWQHDPGAITTLGPLDGGSGGGGGTPPRYQPAIGPVPGQTNPAIQTV